MANSRALRLVAARADLLPSITKYMSALDVALLAGSSGHDVEGATKNFTARKDELRTWLADTDVTPDVRSAVKTLLNGGQALLDGVLDNSIGLRDRITTYGPLLLTAEDVITASVRADGEWIRAQVAGLSRAVGARGQMTLQQMLVTGGADLPEPRLRTSLITLAGTEPSTLFGLSAVLGIGSPDARNLQQQMVIRMAIMSDPAITLVDNRQLLDSIHVTKGIADRVINDATASVTESLQRQASDRRDAAIRDAVLVSAAIAVALGIVLLLARTLVGPLRALRDGAVTVAYTDLADEIVAIRAGGEADPEREPVPLAAAVNAAVSEVEDHRRVHITGLPDCTVNGAVAGAVIHLLAELIDNALRYSPPTTRVRVSAVRGSEGGVLLRVADSGLGMTEADRRVANTRLQSGGEVPPDSARHLGLFVVGRLASRHGIRVGLRGPEPGGARSGTTAEVYLPLAVLTEGTAPKPGGGVFPVSPPQADPDRAAGAPNACASGSDHDSAGQVAPPVSLLPRRDAGLSGITDIPAPATEQRPSRRKLPTPWWARGDRPAPQQASAPPAPRPPAAAHRSADDDVIYQRMLSEMVGDPHELARSADLDWRSVWDHGWSARSGA